MKPSSVIFPVIALAIAGAWLGIQHRAISSLEQARGHLLEKAIASRASDRIADSQSGKPPISSKAANDKEPLDWKKLGALLVKMQDGADMTDILDRMKVRQRFMAMSKEEVVAALDEITALNDPKGSRDMLEQLILGSLIEKDPEFVLTKYIGRIPADGTFGGVFSNALEKWAEKDLTAASNWYDQQNAAGAFDSKSLDGKNDTRLQIEGNLINLLLATDPAAAVWLRCQKTSEPELSCVPTAPWPRPPSKSIKRPSPSLCVIRSQKMNRERYLPNAHLT